MSLDIVFLWPRCLFAKSISCAHRDIIPIDSSTSQ